MRIKKHVNTATTAVAQPLRCKRSQQCSHDMLPRSILLIAFLAYTSSYSGGGVDALSFPGRGIFRRNAVNTDTTEIIKQDEEKQLLLHDSLSEKSPSFTSSLFTSPTYHRDRSIRQHRIIQNHRNRRKLLRQGLRNSQLNYKDHDDDDLLNIVDSDHHLPTRPRIFRGFRSRRRKSLSQTLFPPEPDVGEVSNTIEDELGLLLKDEFEVTQEETVIEDEKEVLSSAAEQLDQTSFSKVINPPFANRKKKSQVVVSNIDEIHEAILDKGLQLRDVELNYSPPESLLTSKRQQEVSDGTYSSSNDIQELALMTNELNPEFADIELEDDAHEPNADELQLIGNVLAEDFPEAEETTTSKEVTNLFSHDVLNLLHQRYHSQSTPMSREANDTAILALSIEGGGMRGAVSGGMAAAIACLGLSNAFDSIYGSSAGSIIGSYFVSRQLYLDVYTDVIPAGKDLFVSKTKIIGDIFRNMLYIMKGGLGKRLNNNLIERFRNPDGTNSTLVDNLPPTRQGGLNTSFVLDSIMCPERGLRPLDLEAFAHNDAIQPLRIVSSSVELETGELKSICFGSNEGNFADQFGTPNDDELSSEYLYPEIESAEADENGLRRGLWACLGASMLVPGAADSPFKMSLPSSNNPNELTPHLCFDAFCYEPVPFRSAVAEGATHVLALRSRPAGYEPKTKQTFYERAVAPLYFRSNGVNPTVANFFQQGGQQYLYAEDVLLCDKGLNSSEAIPIPRTKPIYASPEGVEKSETDRENWSKAHLLPITVPADVPELSVLSQDREDIVKAIREGFAAAYDALAPVVGVETGPNSLTGLKVAELVFPDAGGEIEEDANSIIELSGEKLTLSLSEEDTVSDNLLKRHSSESLEEPRQGRLRRLFSVRRRVFRFRRRRRQSLEEEETVEEDTVAPTADADHLFSFLPGVSIGSIPHVAERLTTYLESVTGVDE